MLAQQILPAAHAGEDQSSPDAASAVFAPRTAHWANILANLLGAAKTFANTYLQEERNDTKACFDADHHKAVVELFTQIENADALGLSLAGALQLAADGQASVQLWYAKSDRFTASTMLGLVAANDWLRPGDVVYQAQTIERHTLTEADIKAARPIVIGGAS